MRTTWIVAAILIIFAIIVRVKLKNFKETPTGFQNVVETLVEMIGNFTKNALGEKLEFLGAYFFGVFVFILVSNYIGLVPFLGPLLRPPTTDIATTLALGIMTFILIHYHGIRSRKGGYFKQYLKPFFLFLPFNVMGELSRPISLGFRLFGNILGGFIVLEAMYSMLPAVLTFLLPAVGHAFFDLFAGLLQAFVFTMLSMTFISVMAETE